MDLRNVNLMDFLSKGGILPTDDMAPNFFTVNAAGEITAEFEGIIHALGLVLPEATKAVEKRNVIAWVDAINQIHSEIFGNVTKTGNSALQLIANNNLARIGSFIDLQALNNTGQPAGITLNAFEKALEIQLLVNEQLRTLLNGEGKSDYLQLTLTDLIKLSFGSAEVEFDGINQNSVQLTISHGLERTVKVAFAIQNQALLAGTNWMLLKTGSMTATTFKLQARSTTEIPAAGKYKIVWLAIG